MSTSTVAPAWLPDELRRLADDPDEVVRAVARAVLDTATDALDFGERAWHALIEELRARVERSDAEVSTALLSRSTEQRAPLGETARRRSKKPPWTDLLLLLVRRLQPEHVLELGAAVGISSAYLAAGLQLNGRGRLVSVDGAPGLADVARRHLDELGLGTVEVVTGMFQEVLPATLPRCRPLHLVFVDGHHDEHATQRYFEQLLPALADPAVVVFDDIAWSEGMERAWQALRAHPAVRLALDLERVGVCVVGSGRRHGAVDLPALSTMRATAATVDGDGGPMATVSRRLLWGTPARPADGWTVVDRAPSRGVRAVVDPADGLPFADGSLEVAVAAHTLQGLELADLLPALLELRRVLVPGGTLRLTVPDLERLVEYWQAGDTGRFLVPNHQVRSPSGKLIVEALWYGANRSLFTYEFLDELLTDAGFRDIRRCAIGETGGPDPGIVEHDDRASSSLVIEAVR